MVIKNRLSNGNFATIPMLERLNAKINKTVSCWEWVASKQNGYGILNNKNGSNLAHRIMYELYVGEIPNGLVIDHLCRNKGCVNPKHLEPVTQRENITRGDQPKIISEKYKNQKKCIRGHSLENNRHIYTRVDKSNGKTYLQRRCKTCVKENYQRGKNVRVEKV